MIFHIPPRSRQLFHKTSLTVQTVVRLWNLNLHSQTTGLCVESGFSSSCKSEELHSISTAKPPHMPVMIKEVLHYLDIHPGHVVLDMTFGGGGHTKAVLKAISDVTVLALDRDPMAISLAEELAKENPGRVKPFLGLFSELESLLSCVNVKAGSIDAVLLDAGCSSMQLDQAERGFSLSKDGPLDMRMDGVRFSDMPCAADVVNTLDQQALASILTAYGEERHARKIASAIVEARRVNPITRTQQLASVVAGSFPSAAVYARKDRLHRPAHVATKTFQALRIFVNNELNELHAGLQAAQTVLRSGGRLCVITFHSLEDRLVKRFLQGDDLSNFEHSHFGLWKQRTGKSAGMKKDGSGFWHPLSKKVITPEKDDVKENARARSAKLRVALRC
ncbi:probable methyltransferase-like protein 15 isoform X1 [Corythoichthys intestinalis]|uniref:probable methyltransferase-like protein 15 isoform X1 n=2 Tax=Corythoichthys intestinalis TaxID=161448 RepID=UPI0025A51890|nr:probable methyltransferase-like protein 15 isoform X1 [Corythoichthys intestinalis]